MATQVEAEIEMSSLHAYFPYFPLMGLQCIFAILFKNIQFCFVENKMKWTKFIRNIKMRWWANK